LPSGDHLYVITMNAYCVSIWVNTELQLTTCTTHYCLVEHQLNKTRQSFPLALHTSLCLVLDCQTEETVTYNITSTSRYQITHKPLHLLRNIARTLHKGPLNSRDITVVICMWNNSREFQ